MALIDGQVFEGLLKSDIEAFINCFQVFFAVSAGIEFFEGVIYFSEDLGGSNGVRVGDINIVLKFFPVLAGLICHEVVDQLELR